MDVRPKNSISMRLAKMNMLVSTVALLLACVGFLAYDQITFRESLVHTLSAQAQIIGSNTVSAILFNDPQSAEKTLSALRSSPSIDSAGILTAERRPFATYTKNAVKEIVALPLIPDNREEVALFRTNHVVLIRRIVSEGRSVGYVYIRAELGELVHRLKRYSLIAASVLVISLIAAMLVSSIFRRSVARPIIQLAETAQKVSRERDYRLRAVPTGEQDEIATLIGSFNEMLDQIQQRDLALQRAHDELEQRVADRTRELLSANRELEAFSYSVSHDLRGPVDAMNGLSYLLLKKYGRQLDDSGRELIEGIRSGGKRMMELIDDLLNLSRVSTSMMVVEKVDLSAIARGVAQELCKSEPTRQVEFVVSDVPLAYGDGRLLRIAIENLLRNSWKYTSVHELAKIEFGASSENGQKLYFVRDDGAGFDPRHATRLFQPFQRLHSPAEFPGNGIGLATVQRIIRRHRGEIWAEGQVDHGATFYFTLNPLPTEAQG